MFLYKNTQSSPIVFAITHLLSFHASIIKDRSNQPIPSGSTPFFSTPSSQAPVITPATIEEMKKHALVEALKITRHQLLDD